MAFLGKFLLCLLLVLPTTLMVFQNGGSSLVARAEMDDSEDVMEGEDDEEAVVENDEGTTETGDESVPAETEKEEEEEEEVLKPSPDADTHILFTKPAGVNDFPAGHMVRFLVGFVNKGGKDFIVDTMEASFRYPQDFTFFIQNFSTIRYDRLVEPSKEATFEYGFTPSESFNARAFGLTINLNYKDSEGAIFRDAVFNDTINIVEPDEGLDGETFFLYVFLAAVAVLLLVGAQQLLATYGKKRLSKPRAPVEVGTQSKGVDYDWLPPETLAINKPNSNKSPGRKTPRQSPRERRVKRTTGRKDD